MSEHEPGIRNRGGSARVALAALGLSIFGVILPAGAAEPEGVASLETEIARLVEASDVPGVAVALVSRGGIAIWSAGFGAADAETGEPVSPATLFRVNSVSKSFVAMALVRLAEQGRIDLDARLRDVAPEIELENRWEDEHPVRVVHLLEHTTGFDDLHLREYAFGRDEGTLRDALAVNPAPRVARWPPGTRMAYDNGGYAVAAYLIEKVTGERFEEVIEREVLRPLAMDASGFGLERIDRARIAKHYLAPGAEEPAAPYPALVRPAGALITSADDLAAFVACLLRRGDPLVSAAGVARIETPRTTDAARAGLRVGYGLGNYTSRAEGRIWHGHAGGTPSAYARYAYQPELGVGYALLMNGADGRARKEIEAAIERFLVAGLPEPEPPPAGTARAPLEGYEGTFRQGTANWELTAGLERLFDVVRVSRDGRDGEALTLAPLLGEGGDGGESLVPAGGDLFRRRFQGQVESEPSVAFVHDESGRVTGVRTWDAENLRAGNYERSSIVRAWIAPLVLLLSIALMASALLVAPVRAIAGLLRREGGRWRHAEHLLPPLAVIALLAAIAALVIGVSGPEGLLQLGRPSAPAIAFWLLGWAFALLSAAALAVTSRAVLRREPPGRIARVHSFLVALACSVVAVELATWGLLGLRTWAY